MLLSARVPPAHSGVSACVRRRTAQDAGGGNIPGLPGGRKPDASRAGTRRALEKGALSRGLDPLHLPPYIQKLFNKPGEPHEGA
jgi:hypothetical protein